MEERKSWFYLTLWRGTPPEFTSEFDVKVAQADHASVLIHPADEAEANIETASSSIAQIHERETTGADVITTTEVVWRVRC